VLTAQEKDTQEDAKLRKRTKRKNEKIFKIWGEKRVGRAKERTIIILGIDSPDPSPETVANRIATAGIIPGSGKS